MCNASGPGLPRSPDFWGGAQQQGAENQRAAGATARLNNPSYRTPWGGQDVSWGPDGSSRINQFLNPMMQGLFERSMRNQGQASDLYGSSLSSGQFGQPFDWSQLMGGGTPYDQSQSVSPGRTPQPYGFTSPQGVATPGAVSPSVMPGVWGGFDTKAPDIWSGPGDIPAMPQASEELRKRVTDAMMSRSNADLQKNWDARNSALVASGITPGSEAYSREQVSHDRARNDAEMQAMLKGGEEVGRQYGQDLSSRQQGWNEAVAGSQLGYGQTMGLRNQELAAQNQQYGQGSRNADMSFNQRLSSSGQDFQQRQAEAQRMYMDMLSGQGQAFGQGLASSGQDFQQRLASMQQGQGAQAQRFGQQNTLQQQAVQRALMSRQIPFSEMMGLRGGSQFQMPQFPNYTGGGQVAPSPYFGAMDRQAQWDQGGYNARAGQYQGMQNGLFGLGRAALGSNGLMSGLGSWFGGGGGGGWGGWGAEGLGGGALAAGAAGAADTMPWWGMLAGLL